MRRAALAFLLALVVVPAVASAQMGFGLSAGMALPVNDLATNYNSGYHVQGALNLTPTMVPAGFRIDGTYDHFNLKPTANGGNGSEALAGISANMLLGLGGPLTGPYVIAGLGVYRNSIMVNTLNTSQGTAGFNIGAGMKFGVGTLKASVEARFFYVNGTNGASDSSFTPFTVGIAF